MAETTGIPIIERLDALEWPTMLAIARGLDADGNPTSHYVLPYEPEKTVTVLQELWDAVPELRAELLRLQEERDSYRTQVQMAKQQFDTLQEERDALLEALKVYADGDNWASACDWLGESAGPSIARAAIAHVEGSDAS